MTSDCFYEFQAENVLVRNAQNLMESVVKTLRVIEAASIKVGKVYIYNLL